MARQSKEDRQLSNVNATIQYVRQFEDSTTHIRDEWRDNHQVFHKGTTFIEKESWQANFSINKLGSAVRAMHSKLKRLLINNADWFDIEPSNLDNEQAAQLVPALKKLVEYYLETAQFSRHASQFILQSLISIGAMYVGWRHRKVRNPAWVQQQAQKELEKARKARAKSAKVLGGTTVGAEDVVEDVQDALSALSLLATGEAPAEPEEEKEYIAVGGLDLQIPLAENIGFDITTSFIEDSEVQWFRTRVRYHQLMEAAKWGAYDKAAVKKIGMSGHGKSDNVNTHFATQDTTYKGISGSQLRRDDPSREVDILIWHGPLLRTSEDGEGWEVEKENWRLVIANDSVILKEGPNPFWEPRNHKGPMIITPSREIPHRSVGDSPVGLAKDIQKAFDSNNTLLTDAARLGIVGINIVKQQSLVEKSLFEEGIEPGATIAVREDPGKVWRHENLTSNIENQASPVQNEIRNGINELVGVSAIDLTGSNNLRSRTSATEIQAGQQGTQTTIDQVAVDLEERFLKPFLEKVLARILQFGLSEIRSNPEVSNVLTEREIELLAQLNEEDKASMLFGLYRFKIKGFSFQADHQERLKRLNEAMTVVNSGGPLGQVVPMVPLAKVWFDELDFAEIKSEIDPQTEVARLNRENQTLVFENRRIEVLPTDNDEVHLQSHSAFGQATGQQSPALQEHIQMHQQQLQQKQMQQQAQEQAQQQIQAQQIAAQQEGLLPN